jgi:hypothetical protein
MRVDHRVIIHPFGTLTSPWPEEKATGTAVRMRGSTMGGRLVSSSSNVADREAAVRDVALITSGRS